VNAASLTSDLNDLLAGCDWLRRLDATANADAPKGLKAFASRVRKVEQDFTISKNAIPLQTFLILAATKLTNPNELFQALGIGPSTDPRTPIEFDERVNLAVQKLAEATTVLSVWARTAARTNVKTEKNRYSAVEILISQGLPHLFKKHFGQAFGAGTAGDRGADGPGIRFILACFAAASITRDDGQPYSAETVRTYWSNFRRRKDRRTRKMPSERPVRK
jgi:hypothetical protein